MNLSLKVSTASLRPLFSLLLLLCTMVIFSPTQAMNLTPNESAADDSEPAIGTQAQARNTKLEIMIPLYIYPNWWVKEPGYVWEHVVKANSQVHITAIINPCNGPIMKKLCNPDITPGDPANERPNSDYEEGLKDLREAGVTILGYVPTNYGNYSDERNISHVKDEINLYHQYFDVDGIFFDEVASGYETDKSNDEKEQDLADYKDFYNHVKGLSPNYQVVLNPGNKIDEKYISQQAGDTAIIFEGTPEIFNQYTLDPYVNNNNYSSEHFAILVHNVSDVNSMQWYLNWAMRNNIRYVYVTKDSGDNPWDTLPSYWQEEVDYVELLNTVSCGGLTQEAEAGQLSGLFEIGNDPNASNGQYVHVPNNTAHRYRPDENHKVTYCFNVPTAGKYRLNAKAHAVDGHNDSFYVRVDGAPANGYLWDVLNNTTYETDYVSHRRGDDPVEVELSAGQHIVTVYLREDGTRLDTLELELVEQPVCRGLTQEAEAGVLNGLFEIGHDRNASNGQYVHVPNHTALRHRPDENHKVSYCFNVPTAGTYRVKGKVYTLAPYGNNDSFYVRVDDAPASGYLWDTLNNTNYQTDYVNHRYVYDPVEVELRAGEHIVTIYLREDGTRLDTLELERVN